MEELLYREEMMWMQRARVNWLKEGNHNTKYFHRKAADRAKKNKIKRLRRMEETQKTKERWEPWPGNFSAFVLRGPGGVPIRIVRIGQAVDYG
jgi:hypothetical protein